VALVAGVKLAQVDGAVYCEQVAPGSAAATAGLVVGDRVLSVDGKSFADHVAAVGKYVAHPNDPWYFRTLLSAWLVGAPGSKAQIAIARDNATLEVPRVAPVPAAGPPIVAQRLAGAAGKQYGYVRIAHFLTADVVQQFDAALDGLLDVAGLILDVRENGGGESAVGNAIIARLIEKPVPVAKDYLRGSASEFYVTTLQPRGTAYKGPVAVLIDESSFSNGHLFPSQLKELGRAILVGRTTGGGSAAVERWQLTEALTVQLSKAVSITAQGAIADELGTVPDVAVTRTAADVQAGLYAELGVPAHDVVLQRALERL
jgi:carboxyl-terminal processing protease